MSLWTVDFPAQFALRASSDALQSYGCYPVSTTGVSADSYSGTDRRPQCRGLPPSEGARGKSGNMRPEDSGGDSTCASGARPRTNSGAGCSYPFATDHGGNDGISADHTTGARAESHGQIVDVPTSQIQEEIAAVIQVIPQERVSESIPEQTRRCSSPSDSRMICRNLEVHPTRPCSAAH